jgi:hypothetical protein
MTENMHTNIITSILVKNFFEEDKSLIGNSMVEASNFTGKYFHLRVAGLFDETSENISPIALFASTSEDQTEACFPLSKSDQNDPYDFIQNFLSNTLGLTSNDDNYEMIVDTICDGLLRLNFEPSSLGKIWTNRGDFLELPKELTSRDLKKLNYLIHRTVDLSGISINFTKKHCGSEVLQLLIKKSNDDTFMSKKEVIALAFKAS